MSAENNLETKYVFGIDLGTTYSEISYLDDNLMIQVCKNHEGSQITPSVVQMDENGVVVGQIAKDEKVFSPHNVMSEFKRQMDEGDTPIYYGENADKTTTPVKLSAEVLRYLAKYASELTESAVKIVTITVPAYFSTEQKAATKKAAELAGFADVYLIEEPTAAAVYYGCRGDRNETVLVYDLGGGTFDIVAVDINGYNYNCFIVDGDSQLGGKDWDDVMIEIIKNKLVENDVDINSLDESDFADIQIAAEEAKKSLTQLPSKDIKFKLSTGEKVQVRVTKEEFETETKSLLDRTIERTRKVKEKAEQMQKKISRIILIGGSTYMPQVRERLIAEFSDVEVPAPMDPNLAVSMGAAYYGKVIIKETEEESGSANEETAHKHKVEIPAETEKAREELRENAKKNNWVIPAGEIIQITKVSVSSIGLKVKDNDTNEYVIMTLLKAGSQLPVSEKIDLPISGDAIRLGEVTLALYEHRSEEDFLKMDDPTQYKEMSKQNGAISSGLPAGSLLNLRLEIDEEGLLNLIGTDPNGMVVELKAKANAGSASN